MKNQSVISKILLGLILIFSFFIYTYKNTAVPPSLYSDEADISYQAFIFNKNFSDYFGNKFPAHFHSFSDWQPSLYIYSVALVQKIIGHTDVSVRIPAAIFGTLTVFIFFLILKQLLKQNVWALIGTLLLSISPWLFHYSRTGFAATNMLFLTLLGIYFWINFIESQKTKYLFLSIFVFSLLTFSYSTAKLHLLFLFASIYFLWFKKINAIPVKTKILSILLILIVCLPIISDTLKGRSGYRFSYINIFSDPTVSKTTDFLRQEDSVIVFGQQIGLKPMFVSKVFHNKIAQWLEVFTKNYFSSFSTEFLFIKGDGNLRQGIQSTGNLLYPDLLFVIIGISSLFLKKSKNYKFYLLFFINLILAPIPFALTRDSTFPHATRLISMLPFLIFFSVLGIKKLFFFFQSKTVISFVLIIYLILFGRFLHQYYFHYSNLSAKEWHYSMKDAVISSLDIKNDWERIYYSNSYEPFTPFFLNYSEYLPKNNSPADSLKWDNNSFFTGRQVDNKYYLGNIEWSPLFVSKPSEKYLFIVPEKDIVAMENSLNEYNKSSKKRINLNLIKKIDKKYTEQESFYLLNFKYN